MQNFDFLIIGCGLSGLYAADFASRYGKVALITKTSLERSNSAWAQGGIAAAISPSDSLEEHLNDTMEAGRGLCDRKAVEILVKEGKERILELIKQGMQFDKENGKIALGLEGGHNKRRILHAGGNITGKKMVDFLSEKVKNSSNITLLEDTFATKLLVKNNKCFGANFYHPQNNKNFQIMSTLTLLATGGASGLYKITTNQEISTGDGIALAYREGAIVTDIEFIQFHPTAFYNPKSTAFLLSEALRGEGAYLLNNKKERFMEKVHPLKELAPRDIVVQNIVIQMMTEKTKNIYLSLQHLDSDKIKTRFNNLYQKILPFGIDITKDLIPVVPAAHYSLGGIKTNYNAETNIQNLFACGEVTCTGVHGANRLASNSLLECIVFAEKAIQYGKSLSKINIDSSFRTDTIFTNKNNLAVYQNSKTKIAQIMSNNVGIIRNSQTLEEALEQINTIKKTIKFTQNEFYHNQILQLIQAAQLIIKSAYRRKESRGGHNRMDYPNSSNDYMLHIHQQQGEMFLQ